MNRKLILILFLIPLLSNAQVVSDAKLWVGVSVNKKIKDFEFSFTEEFRMDENVSHIDKVFSELGAEYKLVKGFYVSVNYRFNRDNDYETSNYDLRHRIDLGLTYKLKFDKFRLSYRTKIQTKNSVGNANSPTYSRNKLMVKYKLGKAITPFISYEFYYQFNDQNIINRTRLSLGGKYAINDKSGVKLFYMYENKFNVKNLKHNHVYGVSYSIDL